MKKDNKTKWIIAIIVLIILNIIAWVLYQKHIWISSLIPFIVKGIFLFLIGVISLIIYLIQQAEKNKEKPKVYTKIEAIKFLQEELKKQYNFNIKMPYKEFLSKSGEEGNQVEVPTFLFKDLELKNENKERLEIFVQISLSDLNKYYVNIDTSYIKNVERLEGTKSFKDVLDHSSEDYAPTKAKRKSVKILTDKGIYNVNEDKKPEEKKDGMTTDKKEETK